MAVYKVPQDVEADDKLIGPFSFRQFIYLIIVAISMGLAWLLGQVNLVLSIIPLPVILFFSTLALPLRKDQPMEAYLSAVVSFYFLKSRKRLWQPDGIDSFVTIIPPKNSERILTKGLDETEASRRLGYLAELVDTHGWAIRGAGNTPDTSISTDLYYESQSTEDMFDTNTEKAQEMNQKLADKANEKLETAKTNMQKVSSEPVKKPVTASLEKPAQPAPTPKRPVETKINTTQNHPQKDQATMAALEKAIKIASATNQKQITPEKKQLVNKTLSSSVSTPDTDTIGLTRKQAVELSQNNDLSVKTLAEEANRIAKKNREALLEGEEVTISLR